MVIVMIQKIIKERRSIRKYTGEPISEEQMKCLLEAGFYAPTARNIRPTHFIIIKDKNTLEEIASEQPNAKYCVEAGCGILVCGDTDMDALGYIVEDASAAIQNILLSAHGMGLGTVWCGVYPREERVNGFKRMCGLPENILPVGFVIVGNPAEEKETPERFNEANIHEETWG